MNALRPGTSSRLFLALALALGVASCTEPREIAETPEPAVDPACIGCHGDESGPAPRDAAHRIHLDGSALFAPVACEDCHPVPETVSAPGHTDTELPADVVFGGAALVPDAAAPVWDAEAGTCAGVACHGGALEDAAVKEWRVGAFNLGDCGACHAAPPGGSHPYSAPTADACVTCHGELTSGTHGDGVVDVALPDDCDTCHGDAESPAPVDLVHRAHVLPGAVAGATACESCHPAVSADDLAAHLDAPPAEVTFDLLATHDGATPAYADGSCAGTYCHSGAEGGAHPAPAWSDETSQASTCTACHGDPPAAPHPQMLDCQTCHGPVVAADAGVIATPERHVDGVLDEATPEGCTGCHGAGDDAAPLDALHTAHGVGATLTDGIDCAACHVVPAEVFAPGHVDTAAPAEVTFGGVATTAGSTPAWDTNGASCVGTWCHGGGDAPVWMEDAEGTWTACDACHGAPPAVEHPMDARCEVCHAAVAGPELTLTALALHVDGEVQWAEAACDACHGAAGTPAPDTGAHLAHLSWGVACAECHLVPAAAAAAGHLDDGPPAELTFGDIASAEGSFPNWDAVTQTCSGAWCHDAGDGDVPEPVWTDESGAAGACGACHAVPPDSPVHNPSLQADQCGTCHSSYPEAHVDGTISY